MRRAALLALILVAASVPAIVGFRGCTSGSCAPRAATIQDVPFCSLPAAVRSRIAAGYQDGRSPDVLAVSADASVVGSAPGRADDLPVPWLSVDGPKRARVPLVFTGPGVTPTALAAGTRLDSVGPTLVRLLGLEATAKPRSAPDLASVQSDVDPRLVLLVAWEGIGSADLDRDRSAWPALSAAVRDGAGTIAADTGSLPVDPAAVLATIGTGSLPAQHGITGAWLRTPYGGALVHAGGPKGPPAELPTVAQELEHATKRESRVALVAPTAGDEGLVGTTYYVGDRPPDVRIVAPDRAVAASRDLLGGGLGSDATPDVLAVVLRGTVGEVDRQTERLLAAAATSTSNRYVAVVTGTGSLTVTGDGAVTADDAGRALGTALPSSSEVVQALVPGGLYLRKQSARSGVSGRDLVDAFLQLPAPGGGRLMRDSFTAFAVSLGKYCG